MSFLVKRKSSNPTTRDDFFDIQDRFNQLFNNFFTEWPGDFSKEMTTSIPRMDVKETETDYQVEMEVPGMDMNDLDLSFHDNALLVKGEKRMEKKNDDKKEKYHRLERYYGSFSRAIPFDEEVDHSNIDAHMKDGILSINLKKLPTDQQQARKINIRQS